MLNSTIILASLLVSLVSLVGIISLPLKIVKFAKYFVAIATGALLGDVFFHILPEIVDIPGISIDNVFLFTLLGIGAMFIFESIFRHIHCHEQLKHNHHESHNYSHDNLTQKSNNPLGTMNLIGNTLHNFLDGVLIASSFIVNPVAGWATTLAIIAHEIPIEMSNFALLIHSGFSRQKALIYNGLTAIFGLFGSLTVIFFGQILNEQLPYLSAFGAGFLLYIAMSDLIPEIHTNHSRKPNYLNFILIILAILLMYWLKTIES